MTTPVRTTIPKTQKQQNFTGERNYVHAARNRMIQTVPQHNRNSQPLSNQQIPPENMYYNTAPRKVTRRVHQLSAVRSEDASDYGNDDRNQFTPQSAYPSSPSQQPVSLRSISTTNNSGASVPTHSYYTQKQQNFTGERNYVHAARNRMIQTVPQHNRNSQPLSNQPTPPENMYYNTAPQKVTRRVHQLSTVRSEDASDYRNDDRNQFTPQSAYPSSPSQQPVSQSVYQPRLYHPPSTMRSISTTNNSGASVPTHSYYSTSGMCGETGATTTKQKVEDMEKKRRELQDKMKRDAEEYMKKKKEKEQKKKEDYIMRHRFMFPDLFGGHKLGDNNNENLYDNSQPEIYSAPVDPVALRIQQEEARRKMQEEYDTKAQEHAEKMKNAEEAKRAQQAEIAAKMKAEADKYKVGRQNTEDGVAICTGLDVVTLRTEQNENRRKMQDNYSANAKKRAQKMIRVEEAKYAQQAELAAKRNSEAYKHQKAGLQKTPDVIVCPKSVVKLSENKATRKTQDHLDKIDVQNNSCISNTTCPIQTEKLGEQESNKDDLEYQKYMDTWHYKYGVQPAVPTLKLRLNSVNNEVKKHVDKELDNNGVGMIKKIDETRFLEHVSPVSDKKPVDKEKEFLDEMRRARLKMQEAMDLKIQEFQTKSKKEADLP